MGLYSSIDCVFCCWMNLQIIQLHWKCDVEQLSLVWSSLVRLKHFHSQQVSQKFIFKKIPLRMAEALVVSAKLIIDAENLPLSLDIMVNIGFPKIFADGKVHFSAYFAHSSSSNCCRSCCENASERFLFCKSSLYLLLPSRKSCLRFAFVLYITLYYTYTVCSTVCTVCTTQTEQKGRNVNSAVDCFVLFHVRTYSNDKLWLIFSED